MPFFAKSMFQELAEPGGVHVRLALLIGATGAVTSTKGPGLSDAVLPAAIRTAAGQYTLTLDRQWRSLIGFRGTVKPIGAGAVLFPVIASGDGVASTAIVIETRLAAGTATDPANGDIVYLHFIFNEIKVL